MKLHPLSLSTHGPPTPAKAPRDNARDDAVDKYHRDRLAFISAVRAAPQSLEGVGGALLVRLCQDPEPDVALGACRAVNAVLGEHGPQVFAVDYALRTFAALLSSAAACGFAEDEVSSIQTEACLAMETLWRSKSMSVPVPTTEEDAARIDDLARECAEACAPCLVDASSDDGVRAAAVRAVAVAVVSMSTSPSASDADDSVGAIQSVLEAAKMSPAHDELQEHAFGLFGEKAGSMPAETLDAVMQHAAAWLARDRERAPELERRDAVLTAVVSFVETVVALQGTSTSKASDVVDEAFCELLCSYAEAGLVGVGSGVDVTATAGVDVGEESSVHHSPLPLESTTVILQVLARLMNEREMFSLVVAGRRTLVEAICVSCLGDIEGPTLLPALFCIGHVSKASAEACRLVSSEAPVDVTAALVVVLAHGSQTNVRQVAGWVLGVIGSSSSAAAQHVAASGGLLTLIASISNNENETRVGDDAGNDVGDDSSDSRTPSAIPSSSSSTLVATCLDACTAIISRLDSLPTLVALLKLKATADGDSRIRETLFERIAQLLQRDVALRADFVQQGALESLIALGEETRDSHPELDAHMVQVCSLYPQELVDRCSPKYMRKLIEKFKRESCLALPLVEEEQEEGEDGTTMGRDEDFHEAELDQGDQGDQGAEAGVVVAVDSDAEGDDDADVVVDGASDTAAASR